MHPLDTMLQARSVAVVGASSRPGSVGELTLRQLLWGGFEGTVFPVNPSYENLAGLTCYPSIEDITAPLDLAVLAVGNGRLEAEVEKAIAAGAKSLTIFASCHGTSADGGSLRSRLTGLVDEADVRVCGGNGMGFLNIEGRLRVCGFYQPQGLQPGGISFLTHSGSLFSAMLHNRRHLAFNMAVSTGLEMNTGMSDYLDWVLDLESTRVVALFMETIRDPHGFIRSLEKAQKREVPVVALKVGSSRRGQAAVATHSEAIAGDDAVYEALFDAFGVHRVHSMDEMVDTVELMASPRRPQRGGLGAVLDSGGERALLVDTADRVGVPLPDLGESATSTLAEILDPGLEPANPVDAWGTGRDSEAVFVGCLEAVASDPDVGLVTFSVDLTEEEDLDNAYGRAALKAAALTDKPLAVLAHLSSTVDRAQAEMLRRGGIPVLEGTETGLRAIGHLLARADRLSQPEPAERITRPMGLEGLPVTAILDHYDIPHPPAAIASTPETAVEVADRIGYPVVMKTTALAHRTEAGGVQLGLSSLDEVAAAYHEISSRLGPEVVISQEVPAGVEVGLGMITDPQFGPVVILSAGGTLIELMTDRVALLPRVDIHRARRAVERLGIARLLHGYRGTRPADIEALGGLIARFSELALDASGLISAIELNPVIAGPEGVVAVDVLVRWS